MTSNPTPDELRISELYLRVLDYASRCADGVRMGDWGYLADKAEDLSRRAEQLAAAVGGLAIGVSEPRAHVVVDIVVSKNNDSVAARALHPHRSRPTTATMADPFSHPGRR